MFCENKFKQICSCLKRIMTLNLKVAEKGMGIFYFGLKENWTKREKYVFGRIGSRPLLCSI